MRPDNLKPEQYQEFFNDLKTKINGEITKQFSQYKFYIYSNYMKIKFYDFTYGWYEFQLAKTSPTHKHIFGEECRQVLAFYNNDNVDNREILLKILIPYQKQISAEFGRKILVGEWNKNWAMVGVDLTPMESNLIPEEFAKIIIKFIIITYPLIRKAYKSL